MELRHLRYLAAIAEHRTIRSAAEALNVAQPAISRQLQDLEAELGIQLFVREARGMTPTRAGQVLINAAHRTFDSLDQAKSRARRIADGDDGLIKVGILEAVGWGGSVPSAIARFQTARPKVAMQLVIGSSQGLVDMVAAGTVDVAFTYASTRMTEHDLAAPLFREDRMLIAVHAASNFADIKRPIQLRDFADAQFVWFPRAWSPIYYDSIIAACNAGGLVPNITQSVSGDASMLSASTLSVVAAGLGVAFATSANIDRRLRDVRFHHVRDLDITLELRCVHHRDADRLVEQFVQSAVEQ